MKVVDLTGKRFGRLTVVRQAGTVRNGEKGRGKTWLCICDCGKEKISRGQVLTHAGGGKYGCGCFGFQERSKSQKTHGKSGTPIYKVWVGVKRRTVGRGNEHSRKFYKGVSLCPEWHNFEPFYRWASSRWKKGLDIDRIDTTKGYSPENCRFVTRKENTQNTRRSRRWHVNGLVFESSGDAAKHFGVVQSTIYSWCVRKVCGKYEYPAKKGCYTTNKYGG
jgi:hypothetical protein